MARLLSVLLAVCIACASCQFLSSPYSSMFESSLYGPSLTAQFGREESSVGYMFPYATGSMRGPLIVHKSTPEAEKYVIISNPDRFAEISRSGKLLN
ncbi:hypothetical protein PMAYCL1PPCAC_20971 [Pristionchus mayeri]|uniref:Uncharacterized protein n=1 Tax=Pristionchus mayeri TaxID=1317129 RepID=A0AAN5I4U1_9BILA|nr:hypothetical protein PMAYCL1PPCAC_20971 [Pristionchus mayeri]